MAPRKQQVNTGLHKPSTRQVRAGPVRNSVRTRERLLAAALEAFASAGYAQCGLRQIAAAAGVNVALVQRYFGSKEALFEEALSSVLNIDLMTRCARRDFGNNMAKLLTEIEVYPLPMTTFAIADPLAREISLKILQQQLIVPLGEWLGPPTGEARAVRAIMLCSGFTTYRRLLPLPRAADPDVLRWFAESLQAIVDEDGPP